MASHLVPNYDVKVLLKPSEVLEPNNRLKDAVRLSFSITSSTKHMNVQYLDTKQQDIYAEGWSLRIRKTEDDNEFELTYKKRYPVDDAYSSSTTEGNIDAALKRAGQEGFDSTTAYKPQVEVGYQKQTLSISHDEKVSDTGFEGTDLPSAEGSRKYFACKAPEEFKHWSVDEWGTNHLNTSVVYGPVLAKRFKGTWDNFKLSIEMWPIRKSKIAASLEPIVEASFKTPDLKKALEGRANLVEFLRDRAWFLAEDSLKTKLIMERYGEIALNP